jgi:hypothetical protein
MIKERIIACGSTKWKNRAKIKKVLQALDWKLVECIITGSSKGADTLILSVAKELGLPVIIFTPNLMRFSGSTPYLFRNNHAWKFMKPTRLLIFHDSIGEENADLVDYACSHYYRLAMRNNVKCTVFKSKGLKSKKAK